MNYEIKANLFDGQFSISHKFTNSDFNGALIATELMRDLKTHMLYGRVALEDYTADMSSDICASILNGGYNEDTSYYIGDATTHNITGIVITVDLPDEYDLGGDVRGMNKRLHMYNCFLENFIQHMNACKMPAFFQYDVIRDVIDPPYSARISIMIPTYDTATGDFFDITKFASLEMETNVPKFRPFDCYLKADSFLTIPDGFHVEHVSLSLTDTADENEDWCVVTRDTPNS